MASEGWCTHGGRLAVPGPLTYIFMGGVVEFPNDVEISVLGVRDAAERFMTGRTAREGLVWQPLLAGMPCQPPP
jgi:hypothetical protein